MIGDTPDVTNLQPIKITAQRLPIVQSSPKLEEITITRQRITGDGVGLGVDEPGRVAASGLNKIAGAIALGLAVYFVASGKG